MRKLYANIFLKVLTQEENDDVLYVAKTGWRMKRVPVSCKGR
jgi:hypothetical protein